jgi:hypothetical protein
MVKINSKKRNIKKIRSNNKRNIQYGGRTEQEIRDELTQTKQEIANLVKTLDSLQQIVRNLDNELWSLEQANKQRHMDKERRKQDIINEKWLEVRSKFLEMVETSHSSESQRIVHTIIIKKITELDNQIKRDLQDWAKNLHELEEQKKQIETNLKASMTEEEFLLYIHSNITTQLHDIEESYDYFRGWAGQLRHDEMDWFDDSIDRLNNRKQLLQEKQISLIVQTLDLPRDWQPDHEM